MASPLRQKTTKNNSHERIFLVDTALIILGGLIYLTISIWTCGYLAAAMPHGGKPDYSDPFAIMGCLIWPLILPFVFGLGSLFKKLSDFGVRYQHSQIKKREDYEIKMQTIRQELQDAEKEVEDCVKNLDIIENKRRLQR
jgi:hypothetical protein